jgi:hypothetical protein
MPRSPSASFPALPRWLTVLGSLAIGIHLFAVGVAVLAAPSGPWPGMEGPTMLGPPQFAQSLLTGKVDPATGKVEPQSPVSIGSYLRWIRMPHHYRYSTNRPGGPDVYFEARLKDANGQPVATLKFPDPDANFWVRHRQTILAHALGDDQPVAPPQSEVIAAPAQEVRKVTIWDGGDGPSRTMTLKAVPEHLIPRDRPVVRPSEWSVLLTRSYARYLCQAHGAASVEILRHHREAIPPTVLFMEPPAGTFDELVANFGEYTK